ETDMARERLDARLGELLQARERVVQTPRPQDRGVRVDPHTQRTIGLTCRIEPRPEGHRVPPLRLVFGNLPPSSVCTPKMVVDSQLKLGNRSRLTARSRSGGRPSPAAR